MCVQTLSNLIGGIVYTQGQIPTINSIIGQHEQQESFTASPSRKIFPRGFLWDDGFHNILICKFDQKLCKKIIKNWFQNMDILGWIPREQVRGEEISQDVPYDFIKQDGFEANPPTILLPLIQLSKNEENIQFIKNIYPFLEKHFKWYEKIQQAKQFTTDDEIVNKNYQYPRWRCKNNNCKDGNFFGSGLDDYPRYDINTTSKSHIDISYWLYFYAQTIQDFSKLLKFKQKYNKYKDITDKYQMLIKNNYLDKSDLLFKDIAVQNKNQESEQYIKHIGYITLYPMFSGKLQSDSQELNNLLDILSDENQLFTKFGVRSLSKQDINYGKDDNYWRGNIWLPLNYMILRSLKLYYIQDNQKAQNLYNQLQEGLVINIVDQWDQKGYLYENYESKEGQGSRGHPFTGWTSLILCIASEIYD